MKTWDSLHEMLTKSTKSSKKRFDNLFKATQLKISDSNCTQKA